MALPRKFMSARLTNSALGSVIDNNSSNDTPDAGGLGSLEEVICQVFGFTLDSNITASALGMSNAGVLTKAQIIQSAAGPVGWRFRDTTANKEMRMVMDDGILSFDQNTGSEAVPVWSTKFSINTTTGALVGNSFSSTSAGLVPASGTTDSTKYLSADGTFTVPAASATATSCRLRHNANQVVSDTSFTTLNFNTETWDVNGMHTAGSPSKIVAPVAGKYLICGTVAFTADISDGRRIVQIIQNGSTVLQRVDANATATGVTYVNVVTTANLAASDYVQLQAMHTSTTPLNAIASGTAAPVFSAYRIGG